MIRVPQFPINALLMDEWENLKQSISISSKEFYAVIEHLSFDDLQDTDPAIIHSIWKYFNRARFRSTPYGSFAGIGIIKAQGNDQSGFITVDSKQLLHKFISWDLISQAVFSGGITDKSTLLFTNSTYYQVNDNIRYITHREGKFQLSEVAANPLIFQILEACRFPVSIDTLEKGRRLEAEHFELIRTMINCQLLITDRHPNIIGKDFFNRLGLKTNGKPLYVIAERKIVNGTPDKVIFRHLPDLIKILATESKEERRGDLGQFIRDFQRKFEQRRVPLMLALDPELGVHYGDLIELESEEELIKTFSNRSQYAGKQTNNAAIKDHIQKAILQQSKGEPLLLETIVTGNKQADQKIANSVCVLCSVVDGFVVIDQLGGSTANTLVGRFSIAGENIQTYCRQIAAMEQAANPDILFFDVAYIAETNVDNVNRRQRIYPYQVSILNYDTSESPLTLDDMFLSVINGELILYSRRLKKRLIPRIATAYNYTRSDLSLFRLLGDLQNQGVDMPICVPPSAIFPNLDFYPRVQYHNIILSAAKWKIQYDAFKKMVNAKDSPDAFRDYLMGIGVGRYALTRIGDQTLLFNIEERTDLENLLFLLKKSGELYLEEGFIPKQSIIIDEKGNGYANQFLIALTHGHEIYKGIIFPEEVESGESPPGQFYVPGSEWLYYEIYAHPLRSDALLQDKLARFVKLHRKKISCWFFVRYNEGGEHIRFRLRVKFAGAIPELLARMSEILKPELENGVVSDFLLKTYRRETERYGISRIEKVEQHFSKDSEYVLQLIKHAFPSMAKYQLCVELLLRIREAHLFTNSVFERLVTDSGNALLMEHDAAVADYKMLNNEYRKYKTEKPLRISRNIEIKLLAYERSLTGLLSVCPDAGRPKFFLDLFHMHVNRLFATGQRTHEMVIYYFVSKRLLYLKATA